MSGLRIAGRKCVLRDWTEPDVAAYREYLRPEHDWHDTNGPYFGRPNEAEADRAAARASACLGADLPVPRQLLVIAPSDDENRLVGMLNWYWECRETDWRRIGIGLYDPAVRGRGMGTEALRLWTTYLFETTDALRLDLGDLLGQRRDEPLRGGGRLRRGGPAAPCPALGGRGARRADLRRLPRQLVSRWRWPVTGCMRR